MRIHLSPKHWTELSNHATGRNVRSRQYEPENPELSDHRFIGLFGISPKLCSWYFRQLVLKGLLPPKFKPMHFLWTLHFLFAYSTEIQNASRFNCSENTYRKWVRLGVLAIGSLKLVSYICVTHLIILILISIFLD